MRIFLSFTFFIVTVFYSFAQESIYHQEVKATVEKLFTAMWENDGEMAKSLFDEKMRLMTTSTDAEGFGEMKESPVEDFVLRIAQPKEKGTLDERIISWDIKVDGNLATAWTGYEFYSLGKFSHCGFNSFKLVKTKSGWKIFSIADTRRKDNCN
ncbi:MAG: hypothetical protein RJA52_892 [Bacteroidota bacterium]|jgi:hypothetical protein